MLASVHWCTVTDGRLADTVGARHGDRHGDGLALSQTERLGYRLLREAARPSGVPRLPDAIETSAETRAKWGRMRAPVGAVSEWPVATRN